MKISIGADHRGYAMKNHLVVAFKNYEFVDRGARSHDRTDYPIYAQAVCNDLLSNTVDCGILICGSGIGMSIAANRNKGIYAGLCWSPEVARTACEHDGINVLILPSDFILQDQAVAIVEAWLKASFLGGRYQERLSMIDE